MSDEQPKRAEDEKLDEMEEQMEDLDVPAEEAESLKGGIIRQRGPSDGK